MMNRAKIIRAENILLAMIIFIGSASLRDGYLVVRTNRQDPNGCTERIKGQEPISSFEKNPMNLYLLKYGGTPYLLYVKALGTLIVLGALVILHKRKPTWIYPVIVSLTIFQGGLLIYQEVLS